MKTIFIIILSFLFIKSYSQDTSKTKKEEVYIIVEDMPEFPGGDKALKEFIKSNSKYPLQEKNSAKQGKVFVYFVINKEGNVEQINIKRSVNAELDEEAIRIIKSMPKWKPGTQRGNPVKVAYTVPITFNLEKNKK